MWALPGIRRSPALATGEIGLLNEVDSFAHIDYVRRSVATVSGGSDSLPPYTVWAGNVFSPAQLMNPTVSGPDADPGGDGFNNCAEFVAGTDPLDKTSCLKLNLTPGGTNALLNFNGVSNRSYTVQFYDTVAAGLWQRFPMSLFRCRRTAVELVCRHPRRCNQRSTFLSACHTSNAVMGTPGHNPVFNGQRLSVLRTGGCAVQSCGTRVAPSRMPKESI
jgi:hypothetical protein